MKHFMERMEDFEKGADKLVGLSDYDVLGTDLAIISAICDQLTLYNTLLTYHPNPKEHHSIDIPIDTLWGLGQGILNIVEEIQEKIRMIDEKFDITLKEKYKKGEKA